MSLVCDGSSSHVLSLSAALHHFYQSTQHTFIHSRMTWLHALKQFHTYMRNGGWQHAVYQRVS